MQPIYQSHYQTKNKKDKGSLTKLYIKIGIHIKHRNSELSKNDGYIYCI